jgi:serine/threonine-protein kinase
VFRARDLWLERDVAVKVLLERHMTDPVVAARFEQEARVLAAVGHPNVVAIHDVGSGDPRVADEPFMVMDLCEGGSLADRLATMGSGALHPDDLVPILVDVSAGLAALHALGIVHRDLKPSNILLSDGRARIADLGIALDGPSELTTVGTTVGTLAYLAPEQLAGEPASPASDVHALGVVAFRGLTGVPPRPAGSITEVVTASTLAVPMVSTSQPGLGAAFDAPVGAALARDPSRRPTAADLGPMLASALERWRAAPESLGPGGRAPVPLAGSDAPTVVDLALPPHGELTGVPDAMHHRSGRLAVLTGALVAAISLGLAASLLLGSGGGGGGGSPSAAGMSVAESLAASLTAGPQSPSVASAAPTPRPAATADAYGAARAASEEMRTAIADARGQGGLNGKEPKELEKVLGQFDRALDKRDPDAARNEAGSLAAHLAKLIREGAIDADAGTRLAAAADRLEMAANALPD